jgi:hypothetical protein
MVNNGTRKRIRSTDYKKAEKFMINNGWTKTNFVHRDDYFSIWTKDKYTEEESYRVKNSRHSRVDEIDILLPHKKEFRDYGDRMEELFEILSVIHDQCECQLIENIDV